MVLALRWLCDLYILQEDAFGLEALIATREAEQRSERVAGREERDNEDCQYRLTNPQLWIFCVEAWENEVAARVLAYILPKRHATTHPPNIIHDAASAIIRQYHGVPSLGSGLAPLLSLMLW
jgi:hypothetical protein